jgi:hypothetical protein
LDKRRKRQRLIHKTLHNKLEERYRKNAVKSCTSEVYEEIRVLISIKLLDHDRHSDWVNLTSTIRSENTIP